MSETNTTSNAKEEARKLLDPTGNKKLILSLDGGGMRGAITLAMLVELEEKLEKQLGEKVSCHDLFDMFVGTSSGAIIAANLAMGYSARELQDKELFRTRLRDAFSKKTGRFWIISILLMIIFLVAPLVYLYGLFSQNSLNVGLITIVAIYISLLGYFIITKRTLIVFTLRIISNGFGYAYSIDPFKEILPDFLDKKNEERKKDNKPAINLMRDFTDKVLLTTTKNLETGETAFIISKGDGVEKFSEWTIVNAVIASGSAPIFFPPYKDRFVDGGVSPFNNPCFIAAVETMEYMSDPKYGFIESEESQESKVILISVGTGYSPDGIEKKSEVNQKKVWDWIGYVALEGMDDSLNQQVFLTRQLYGSEGAGTIDFRRFNPSLEKKHIETLGLIVPKNMKPEEFGLDSHSKEKVDFMIDIGHMYGEEVDWFRENALPWDTDESEIPKLLDKGGQPNPEDSNTRKMDW